MTIFKPQSLVFVRICPRDLPNVYDARLLTHTSNLAFSSQISTEGFYANENVDSFTVNGTVFNELFFARHSEESDPLFAIKESKAQQIIFTNTSMAVGVAYSGAPEVTGPVVTFRGDKSTDLRGVNLMDRVVFALEWDLEAKVSHWDATSYSNIVSILQPIRTLADLLNSVSSSAVICSSLTRLQIARELAKIYDSHHKLSASSTDSAQKAVYSSTDSATIWNALLTKLDGSTDTKIGYLAISILFRNTTPKAKDYEFKIHIKISSSTSSQDETAFLAQHGSGFTDSENLQSSGFTFNGFNSF